MLDRLEKLLRVMSSAALMVLFLLIIIQVVMRYGFRYTPFFTEEIGRYALVWCVLLGAAVAVRSNEHISVTLLREWIGDARYRAVAIILDLISLVVLTILAYASIQSVQFVVGQSSDGMQLPLAYPYLVLPLAFGAAFLFAVARLLGHIKRGEGKS